MNKKNFLLGCLILLTITVILGGAQYNKSVQAKKMVLSEQSEDKTKTVRTMVEKLFRNEQKELLANNITKKKIKKALQQSKELPSNLANDKLVNDAKIASLFYKTQEEVNALLKDTILSDDVDKKQLEKAKSSLKKIEPLSIPLFKELSEKLSEATSQFDYNEETIKVLIALFEENNKKVVRDDVTREQFEQVQKKINTIKNKTIKKEQKERLKLIEEQLIKKEEEKIAEDQLLEEERLNEVAEQEMKDILEEEIGNDTNVFSDESINTWEPETPKPTRPWKPETPKPTRPWKPEQPKPEQSKPEQSKPSSNKNPVEDKYPDSSMDSSTNNDLDEVPDPPNDSSTNEDPDKESEPSEEPVPSVESSTSFNNF